MCVLEELWVGQGGLVEWEMGRQLKCSEAVYSGKVAIFFYKKQQNLHQLPGKPRGLR